MSSLEGSASAARAQAQQVVDAYASKAQEAQKSGHGAEPMVSVHKSGFGSFFSSPKPADHKAARDEFVNNLLQSLPKPVANEMFFAIQDHAPENQITANNVLELTAIANTKIQAYQAATATAATGTAAADGGGRVRSTAAAPQPVTAASFFSSSGVTADQLAADLDFAAFRAVQPAIAPNPGAAAAAANQQPHPNPNINQQPNNGAAAAAAAQPQPQPPNPNPNPVPAASTAGGGAAPDQKTSK